MDVETDEDFTDRILIGGGRIARFLDRLWPSALRHRGRNYTIDVIVNIEKDEDFTDRIKIGDSFRVRSGTAAFWRGLT